MADDKPQPAGSPSGPGDHSTERPRYAGWGWRQKPGHSTQSPGGKGGGFPGWGGRKGRGPGSTGTSLAAPTF